MGFRFSRRIRIAPGIRLNLSKSGVSTSVGGRGAWLTFGRRSRATISLPGTGISYSETLGGPPARPASPVAALAPVAPAAVPQPSAPAQAKPPGPMAGARRPRIWWWILLLLVLAPLGWALITM